jgi:hypothetical protein
MLQGAGARAIRRAAAANSEVSQVWHAVSGINALHNMP